MNIIDRTQKKTETRETAIRQWKYHPRAMATKMPGRNLINAPIAAKSERNRQTRICTGKC